MIKQERHQVWTLPLRGGVALLGLLVAGGCSTSTIPKEFLQQAQPGVTLASLKANPEAYKGKVVILGGVIVDKKEQDGRIWLKVKNRPLDGDHIPRIPTSRNDPEAGHYWVMVNQQGLPQSHKDWARLTVVGRVTEKKPAQATAGEPVLAALYLHGWDSSWGGYGHHEVIAESNQAVLSTPKNPKQF